MMSPPITADDVSAGAEMMLFAIAHNDAMFALMCPQAHIICPTGQTSLKKPSFRTVFSWQGQKGSNPRHSVLETDALPAELYPYKQNEYHKHNSCLGDCSD